jgi:hypothetical protein
MPGRATEGPRQHFNHTPPDANKTPASVNNSTPLRAPLLAQTKNARYIAASIANIAPLPLGKAPMPSPNVDQTLDSLTTSFAAALKEETASGFSLA